MTQDAISPTRRGPSHAWFGALGAALLALAALAALPASAANVKTYGYSCEDGTAFDATFDNDADTLTLALPGQQPILMQPARSGSGFRFVKDGYEIHGKGPNALLMRPGKAQTDCSAN